MRRRLITLLVIVLIALLLAMLFFFLQSGSGKVSYAHAPVTISHQLQPLLPLRRPQPLTGATYVVLLLSIS